MGWCGRWGERDDRSMNCKGRIAAVVFVVVVIIIVFVLVFVFVFVVCFVNVKKL